MDVDPGVVIAFVIYFTVVLSIGFFFYKKTRNVKDYVLGNREMGPFVTAMSAIASDMSGWLLMGLPGSIYLMGIGQIWIGIGLAIGSYLAWLIIAKRLRKYSEKCGNSLTISQFLSNRYKDTTDKIKVVSAFVIVVFFTFYVTSGLVAGGNLLTIIFGNNIDYRVAVWITVLIIIGYTFFGGFKAVCWIDMVQAMLILIAVIVVPLAALGDIDGGLQTAIDIVNREVENFTNIFYLGGSPIGAVAIISGLTWALGYFGMPHIAARYMAIKNPDEVKYSRRISLVWYILAMTFVAMIGLVGRAYFSPSGGLENPETVFIELISTTFTGSIFVSIIAGFLFAAILAAVMSSADSQLLVAASTVTNDLYDKMRNKKKAKPSDEKMMWISRGAVIAVALISAVLAMDPNSSIMSLVAFAWAGFGAAFGPVLILSLFWKRGNSKGVLACIAVGFISVILWNTFLVSGGILPGVFGVNCCIFDTGLYELLPGFIFGLIAMVAVSLATEKPSPEIEKEFEEVTAGKFY